MTLIRAALGLCILHVASAAGEFFHWPALTMDVDMNTKDDTRPWTYYFEPTELSGGVGCNGPHINDLDIAKHICDRYDACHWFDGDSDFGTYPGAMGRGTNLSSPENEL